MARRAAVHIDTLCYYERQGLVVRPPRSRSNYRLYPEETVRRVQFIKRAQQLGFSLKEIQELLALRAEPQAQCVDVRERALAKIHQIEHQVRTLQAMHTALTQIVACPSCEVSVLDMRHPDVARRAKSLTVRSVPAVVINGQLADCCAGRGPDEATLRAAGLGQPPLIQAGGVWDRYASTRVSPGVSG